MAGAFAIGIVGEFVFATRAVIPWVGGAGAGIALFVFVQWWDRTQIVTLAPLGRIVAIVLILGCAGGARHARHQTPSPHALKPAAEASTEATTLQGEVADAPERTDDATRFVLKADTLYGAQDTAAVDGRAHVTLRASPWAEDVGPFPDVRQGDIVRLRGILRLPPELRNPGGFDYRAYLARRGICCTMYVGEPERVNVQRNRRGTLESLLVGAREYIRLQIDRYVPSAEAQGVLRALLLGDRSRVTDAQRERFAKTGLMHLLAVSGLHVFLVGMVLYALLRPFLIRFGMQWRTVEIARAVLTILVLGGYMFLTGGRPSVVRAVIMATLFIGGIVFQRSAHPLNTLGVAALILLAVRPPALFDVGFQLSMSAVAGIVTLNPRLLDAIPERYRASEAVDWLVSTGTVSAAAILGTAPVLLFHFGWVSAAGLLLNIVGIPCTGLALSAAILMAITGGMWSLAGASFGSAADVFVQGLLAASRYGVEWLSWAGIRMATPDAWGLGALVAALIALAQWPRPHLRWRWVVAAFLFATLSAWEGAIGRDSGPALNAVFFDVGQGGATLLTTPEEHHVLVDAGPRSPSGSAAEFVILPYLERWGIQELDAIIVTHPDEDHLGGVPALLREISVDRVLDNGRSASSELYEEFGRLIEQSETSRKTVQRGDTLLTGSSVRIQILAPPRGESAQTKTKNNASVVLRASYGEVDLLLPGDIEAGAEKNLVRTYGKQLGSEIVKVPHHGSSTSSTPGFVQAVSDSSEGVHAVISVGQGDRYGMPHETVVSRWERHGMTVHSTAEDGAVWMRTDGQEVWQVHWK
ncbi:MAG: DNA internalization-related competence protein ComEC/Rec2 [Bacteroidetes bacterium QH_6_63_17]|nr:MAG: DNA internalization-related competence protein ComEC/Rec2 [Bacteroidetes bacterium QH_6_63_17]